MRYVSWATFYEGSSDALYLDVLLPRVIRDLVAREGDQLVEIPDVPAIRLGQRGRSVERVTEEAYEFRKAFDIVFVHADSGGRNLEQGIVDRADAYCEAFMERCVWTQERCITITPRHETEAWLLADGQAVTAALGYRGDPAEVGLPADARAAERLANPKLVLSAAVNQISGRWRGRRVENLFPAIANGQKLELLRGSGSFINFEERLRGCLRAHGCVR